MFISQLPLKSFSPKKHLPVIKCKISIKLLLQVYKFPIKYTYHEADGIASPKSVKYILLTHLVSGKEIFL